MRLISISSVPIMFAFGCRVTPNLSSAEPDQERVRLAVAVAMSDARRAIAVHGASKAGLSEIAETMGRLAGTPGLIDGAGLHSIHGNASIGQRVLASDGPEGLNLYLSKLEPDAKTPVHDHSTWGVVHVLEGRDRHVRWERIDDGSAPDRARLRMVEEIVVGPGQFVYWLPPPRDIHSQEAVGTVVWELVMTGRDLSHATASGHRHWFDPEAGTVSQRPPQTK